MEASNPLTVAVSALVEDLNNSSPIVLLHHVESDRILPIWIGDFEARAISVALNKVNLERPLTHNLLHGVIKGFGGVLDSVIVDRLKDKTYFSSIYIRVDQKMIKVDARPSDAIALAITAGIPISVEQAILDVAGQKNPVQKLHHHHKNIEMSSTDIKKLSALLEAAREREQKKS